MVIAGNAAAGKVLSEAGMAESDMFIAVTDSDEVNMIACLVARQLNSQAKIISRLSNPDYHGDENIATREQLGIDVVISPELESAKSIEALLESPATTDVLDFAGGKVKLIGFKLTGGSPIVGRKLSELRGHPVLNKMRMVATSHEGKGQIPRGDTVLEVDDQVFVVAPSSIMAEVFELGGVPPVKLQRVFIYGGGRIGALLAVLLEKRGSSVRLFEPSAAVCRELADTFDSTIVINGDATDMELLESNGVEGADAFVAVSGDDEKNILSCILARQLHASSTVLEIAKPEYVAIVSSMAEVDSAVSTRMVTVNSILHFIRRGDISSGAMLTGINAETLEFVLKKDSKSLILKPLKVLSFPRDAIIGAVVRGEDVIVPTGETVLLPDDRVIVFALPSAIKATERFFSGKTFGLLSL
ncbi:Trk system potassium transporter TrkA, partial [Candidatus Hydrogenedentota bacterium]